MAKWLTCVYRSIDDIQPDESVISQLQQLPVTPLASGDAVRLSEHVVFFPISDERKNKKKQINRGSRFLSCVFQLIRSHLVIAKCACSTYLCTCILYYDVRFDALSG